MAAREGVWRPRSDTDVEAGGIDEAENGGPTTPLPAYSKTPPVNGDIDANRSPEVDPFGEAFAASGWARPLRGPGRSWLQDPD